MSKERPNKDLQAFFERVFGLKFSYKRQNLTSKSLRIQDPKNSAEDGTLKIFYIKKKCPQTALQFFNFSEVEP